MKTRLLGNFFPSPLVCSMCLVLLITTSGCASTNTPNTVSLVPVKKGDHVLVHMKDDRALRMVVIEISSERQVITGWLFYKSEYVSYGPIYVNFSNIESIEAKQTSTASNSGVKKGSCDSTACKGVVYTLWTIIYFGFYPLLFSLVIWLLPGSFLTESFRHFLIIF